MFFIGYRADQSHDGKRLTPPEDFKRVSFSKVIMTLCISDLCIGVHNYLSVPPGDGGQRGGGGDASEGLGEAVQHAHALGGRGLRRLRGLHAQLCRLHVGLALAAHHGTRGPAVGLRRWGWGRYWGN